MERFVAATVEGTPAEIDGLRNLAAEDLDRVIFRMRPQRDKPMERRPWVCRVMLAGRPAAAVAEFASSLDVPCGHCKEARTAELQISHSSSQDGPTVKWLMKLGGRGREAFRIMRVIHLDRQPYHGAISTPIIHCRMRGFDTDENFAVLGSGKKFCHNVISGADFAAQPYHLFSCLSGLRSFFPSSLSQLSFSFLSQLSFSFPFLSPNALSSLFKALFS